MLCINDLLFLNRTTETQQLSNSSPTTDNNQTINTTPHGQKPDTGEKDNGNLIGWVVFLSGVIMIILITFGGKYLKIGISTTPPN